MATAAFRSNTKRSAFPAAEESAASSNGGGARRRSRSLSRYSGRFPPPPQGSDELQTRSGGGSVKGDSSFPEINLEDLADEIFRSTEEEVEVEARPGIGRSRLRDNSVINHRAETGSSRRRGRSVSKSREPAAVAGEEKGILGNSGEIEGVPGGRLRRQRSVSVARVRQRDCELMVKTEPLVTLNGYDSHSTSSNDTQSTAEIRRNYTSKLEQSEKRRQDLLAKLAVEEQRGQELTKIVTKFLPAPKQTAKVERPSWSTRKRNDKVRISKHLTEEAEKIFEDFLSSIEDTDMSSYGGERSDTSSMVGRSANIRHSVTHTSMAETRGNLADCDSAPVKPDGVVLPWLQWETNFPSPSKSKMGVQMTSENDLFSTSQEASAAYYNGNTFTSSRGSWSPDVNGSCSAVSPGTAFGRFGEVESTIRVPAVGRPNGSSFDMDEYVHLQQREELIFEMLRQRQRIDTGIDGPRGRGKSGGEGAEASKKGSLQESMGGN